MLDIINTELNTISPVLRLVSLNCKFILSSFITSRSTGEKVAQTAIGEDRRLFFVIVTLDSTAAGRRAAGQGGRVSKVKNILLWDRGETEEGERYRKERAG